MGVYVGNTEINWIASVWWRAQRTNHCDAYILSLGIVSGGAVEETESASVWDLKFTLTAS